jgi:hypothetical protein
VIEAARAVGASPLILGYTFVFVAVVGKALRH